MLPLYKGFLGGIIAIFAIFVTPMANADVAQPFFFSAVFSTGSVSVTIEPKDPIARNFRLSFMDASGKLLQSATYGAMSRRSFPLPVSCQFVVVHMVSANGSLSSPVRVSKPDSIDAGFNLVRKPGYPDVYEPALKTGKFVGYVGSVDRYVSSRIRMKPSRDTVAARTLRNDFVRLLERYFTAKTKRERTDLVPQIRAKAASLKSELAK